MIRPKRNFKFAQTLLIPEQRTIASTILQVFNIVYKAKEKIKKICFND